MLVAPAPISNRRRRSPQTPPAFLSTSDPPELSRRNSAKRDSVKAASNPQAGKFQVLKFVVRALPLVLLIYGVVLAQVIYHRQFSWSGRTSSHAAQEPNLSAILNQAVKFKKSDAKKSNRNSDGKSKAGAQPGANSRANNKAGAQPGANSDANNNTGAQLSTNSDGKNPLVLPNVLLIGAQKAGTSAMGKWLFDYGICRPVVFKDEPVYFDKEVQFFDNPLRFAEGLEFYAKRFRHCAKSRFAMDATPSTLLMPGHVEKVYKEAGGGHLKNLKVIVVLREPVARELSLYNHKVSEYMKNEDAKQWYSDVCREDGLIMSFANYADVLSNSIQHPGDWAHEWGVANTGDYAYHLKKWLKFIDRKQLLVIAYDEFRDKSQKVEDRIREFLGFDFPGSTILTNTRKYKNKVALPECNAQEKLNSIYEPMNEELYRLLNEKPGPHAEQKPFPKFEKSECVDSNVPNPDPGSVVLPNILLIGSEEAGPHSVGAWLSNAGVCLPEVFEGEPAFHSKEVEFFDQQFRYRFGLGFYAKRFQHCRGAQFAMDATPNTLSFPENVEAIYKKAGEDHLKNLKVIVVLRDPSSYQRSLFHHRVEEYNARRRGRAHWYSDISKEDGFPKTFFEYAKQYIFEEVKNPSSPSPFGIASAGQYAKHLRKWFDFVHRQNILVMSFEELVNDSPKAEQRIRDFLGFNVPGSPTLVDDKWQKPRCNVQKRLESTFETLNQDLYKLLEANPGPNSEQNFFPKFTSPPCTDKK